MDTFNHQHRAAVISSSFHQPILNQYPANDFVEITARKMSQNVNDFNLNYHPAYSEEEKQHEENLRRSSVNATNNFTFNQSITHVNLINNRYHFDLPPPQPFTNHDTFSHPTPTPNINMHISPSANSNPHNMFFKQDIVNRGHFHNTENMENSYHSPPAMMGNAESDNMMSFPTTQHNSYQMKQHTAHEEFQGINNFNKFPLPLHQVNIPNTTLNPSSALHRSKSDYSSGFFPEQPLLNNNNNNNNIFHPFGSSIDKMSNVFVPNVLKSRDQDIEQVDDTQKCKNTIEGTKTSVRRFKKWYKERYNKELDMNAVNRFNAPELLKDFFLDIRDTRPGRVGNEYEPVTLTTYRNGLRRYFLYRKVPPAPDTFDLTDKTFDLVNRHLVTKRDDLKRKGKGNHPNAIESITPEQLEKMWASGAIGTHAPRPLLRLMWWYNTVLHGVRGRMAHHDLTTEDFIVQRGVDGKLVMEYTKGKGDVPQTPEDLSKLETQKKKKFKGLAKETDGGDRDPIRAFEIFKAHRPPGISSFYLTPKHKPKGSVWYNKVPMGKNSIGRVMREIKAISNI